VACNIPARLAANCKKSAEGAAWIAHLPEIIGQLRRRWSLKIGASFAGEDVSCAWVAPAELPDGTGAVLKIGLPHMESRDEISGLRFWNGDPTVRLLDADERLGAMLLERCQPGTSLRSEPEPVQDVIIAELLRRLWRPALQPPAFRPLSELMHHWSEETLAQAGQWTDKMPVREGLRLFRQLPATARAEVTLATDLHAGNVLRARRAPWLVIDPKPFVGDPAYDATQHLFNCTARLRSDPMGTIRRFTDLLGVDCERARLWMFARAASEPRDNWNDERSLALARALAP